MIEDIKNETETKKDHTLNGSVTSYITACLINTGYLYIRCMMYKVNSYDSLHQVQVTFVTDVCKTYTNKICA